MSVTHRRDRGGNVDISEELATFKAQLKEELSAEVEANAESLLSDVRNNLTSAPVEGEEWDEKKAYITGDTVTEEGTSYTAIKFSRGKRPSENPERWTVTTTGEIPSWESIEDGSVVLVGTQVTYEGFTWVCKDQHIKSAVYKPKAVSSKWEKVS